MRTLEYRKIDAFTSKNSLGNPAACIYLKQEQFLTETEMLYIAKQHKGFVSEVIYITPETENAFKLVYYSSECEVDFCGHGTIACMYHLIQETPELQNQKEIIIYTNQKGALTVYNEIETWDAVYITAPNPVYIGTKLTLNEIAENMSLSVSQISNAQPTDIIDAGLKTLIIPIAAFQDEINIFPNEQILKKFCLNNGIDIILIYSLKTENKDNIAHTRVFAPKFGYLEDPATGSGNSAFGYYMMKNQLWDGSPVTIEQGGADRIFNTVNLSYRNSRILFGGKATTRIKGVYYL
ncbi:MAG: PhzF family phenazine biosynthesis isomerase [Oscillospiraceae bacterium]|nr:PhzF family phenazine biosynthesis isomerase [Oscillospiraceae bacterium]